MVVTNTVVYQIIMEYGRPGDKSGERRGGSDAPEISDGMGTEAAFMSRQEGINGKILPDVNSCSSPSETVSSMPTFHVFNPSELD